MLHVVWVERIALAENIDLQAAEFGKLKPEKIILENVTAAQNRTHEPDRNRLKGAGFYGVSICNMSLWSGRS